MVDSDDKYVEYGEQEINSISSKDATIESKEEIVAASTQSTTSSSLSKKYLSFDIDSYIPCSS